LAGAGLSQMSNASANTGLLIDKANQLTVDGIG